MREALREVLAKINENPRYYPAPSSILADEVVRAVRRRIVRMAFKYKYEHRIHMILDELLSPNYSRGILSAYYYLIHELGLEKEDAINLIINTFSRMAGLERYETLSPVETVIADYLEEIIEGGYSLYPLFILDYACELGLIYWDGEKWNLTELGKLMLKLPPYEFTKALLTLEYILSKGTYNCMTHEFLETLRDLFSRSEAHELHVVARTARISLMLSLIHI